MGVKQNFFKSLTAAFVVFVLGAGLAAQGTGNYVIGAMDVLNIQVYEQPEIGGKYSVESDGTFTFWQIGRITAKGLTLRQFENELTKLLKAGYFRDPHVSVSVVEYNSQKIVVTGEVRSPGSYPLTADLTLLTALARAGSTLPSASGEVLIIHAESKVAALKVAVSKDATDRDGAADGGDVAGVTRVAIKDLVSQNVVLQDGDTVVVPRAESVYVFGEVKNPGAYAIQQETTVLQALSLAGGTTPNASLSKIRIVRIENGEKKEIKVKKTSETVRPGDTIIVGERWF
jgi:polysaccharide export outer membrane protein